ncbi:MAG: hypothetical protein OEY59_02055 [Deltaproteobacteria bacterium]|nr:hypothetical protein [Deltaproteobacteria bacterium]
MRQNNGNKPENPTDQPEAKPEEIGQRLAKDIKEAMDIPLPYQNEDWLLKVNMDQSNKEKSLFGLIKKKGLAEEELSELRKSAAQSPGTTRSQVIKLIKQYPGNPNLYTLSAICQSGMLMSGASTENILSGLKSATKESAYALFNNGISVYNTENFIKIYFNLLERQKRYQTRLISEIQQDNNLDRYKQDLILAGRISDQLIGEKKRSTNIIAQLKKKLKSSLYVSAFSISEIQEALNHFETGNLKEKLPSGTVNEVIVYLFAILNIFSHIPIMLPMVESIMTIFPPNHKGLSLRKLSLKSSGLFSKLKVSLIIGDIDKIKELANIIYKDNCSMLSTMEGESICCSYESDPYFNLGILAELTYGFFEPEKQSQLIAVSSRAIEAVIKKDMSKNQMFTELATNHSQKLLRLSELDKQNKA